MAPVLLTATGRGTEAGARAVRSSLIDDSGTAGSPKHPKRSAGWWPDDDVGDEPDYRFSLANERTFLAWVRTSLALLAGGVALHEFVEPFSVAGGRRILALTAIATSAAAVILAYRRWVASQRAMRLREPLPTHLGVPLVAGLITLLAAGSAALVLIS